MQYQAAPDSRAAKMTLTTGAEMLDWRNFLRLIGVGCLMPWGKSKWTLEERLEVILVKW